MSQRKCEPQHSGVIPEVACEVFTSFGSSAHMKQHAYQHI